MTTVLVEQPRPLKSSKVLGGLNLAKSNVDIWNKFSLENTTKATFSHCSYFFFNCYRAVLVVCPRLMI